MHRGLAGRVAAADDEHVFIFAVDGLGRRRAIVHAGARERFGSRDVEHAIRDAGRDDKTSGADLTTITHRQDTIRTLDSDLSDFLWVEELGAKFSRLRYSPPCQISTG